MRIVFNNIIIDAVLDVQVAAILVLWTLDVEKLVLVTRNTWIFRNINSIFDPCELVTKTSPNAILDRDTEFFFFILKNYFA